MTKVKEKLYEHRYWFVFFCVLTGLHLLDTSFDITQIGDGLTYSLYAVDFSFGFCTRFLPGAIFNFLFDDISEEKISLYLYALVFMTNAVIAVFGEKILIKTEEKNKDLCFWVIILILFCFNTCLNAGNWMCLLDIYWIFAVVTFFVCLSNKKLYIFIPLTFVFSVMSQYYSVLNYIPLCILILLYKIFICYDKKEKRILWVITIVSGVISVGILIYMMMFETQNVIGHEEFINRLAERGTTDFEYLEFSFFRTQTGDMFISLEQIQELKESGKIIEFDLHQENKILIMMQKIIQQIQLNLMISEHLRFLPEAIIHIPTILFIVTTVFNCVRCKDYTKQQKFVFVNVILLFVLSISFSLLFSQDTLRFIGHGTLVLVIFFVFTAFNDTKYLEYVFGILNQVPKGALIVYIILYNCALYISRW